LKLKHENKVIPLSEMQKMKKSVLIKLISQPVSAELRKNTLIDLLNNELLQTIQLPWEGSQ